MGTALKFIPRLSQAYKEPLDKFREAPIPCRAKEGEGGLARVGAAWRVAGLLESFRHRLGDYSRIANIWARAGLGGEVGTSTFMVGSVSE